jgi:hypothetical protein
VNTIMKAVIALLLLAGLSACSRPPDVVFDPPDWNFGSIPSCHVAEKRIAIRNPAARAVRLRFISTCDCLSVDEAPGELAAGTAAPIKLSYDPAGQSGFVEAALIVVAAQRRSEFRAALHVYGKVLPVGGDS